MDVEVHPNAEDELNEQAAFYENQATGLGISFLSTFGNTLDLIVELPEIGPIWRDIHIGASVCVDSRTRCSTLLKIEQFS